MDKELTCAQAAAIINFYIEGKLNPRLREYMENHLTKCSRCRKKIEELQKIMNKFKPNPKNTLSNNSELKEDFIRNLSAYVDNELSSGDNIKIKKMTISNPNARKELELMYKYKRMVASAYEKTKNESRFDYSKDILSKIQEIPDYSTNYFYKLSAIFLFLLMGIIGGFIYLYF